MAARTLLLKPQVRGLIELPARRTIPTNRMRARAMAPWKEESAPIQSSLEELGELKVLEVSRRTAQREVFASALAHFHYLGYGGPVGENLQYLVCDKQDRPLACLLFGAVAWTCQDRDRFIGWNLEQRKRNLA